MSQKQTVNPNLALEMTMRDVLGNMEEMLVDCAHGEMFGEFEILAIESTEPPSPLPRSTALPRRPRPIFSAEITSLAARHVA